MRQWQKRPAKIPSMMGMRGLHQSLSTNQSFVSYFDSFMISSLKLSFCTGIFRRGFLILANTHAINLMIDPTSNCLGLIRILQLPYFDGKGQFFPNGNILNYVNSVANNNNLLLSHKFFID